MYLVVPNRRGFPNVVKGGYELSVDLGRMNVVRPLLLLVGLVPYVFREPPSRYCEVKLT